MFAHIRPGSVRVKVGQTVAAGDTLGLCGNSGNSSEPHLHYHLQNSPRLFDADGLPAQFVNYLSNGKSVARGLPVKGERIARQEASAPKPRCERRVAAREEEEGGNPRGPDGTRHHVLCFFFSAAGKSTLLRISR